MLAVMRSTEKPSGESGARVSRQREAGEVTRRETRRRLLAAARAEFAERGYVAATVARIADRAGVSLQTLYSAWGSKRALLRAVMETAVTGSAEPDSPLEAGQVPAPFAADPAVMAADDARSALGHLARQFRLLAERAAVSWQNYRDAAAVEADVASDWQQLMDIRRANIAAMIATLPPASLRDGLTPAAAADTVWVIASPDSHDMLVRRGGYSYDEFERWVRTTVEAAVLAPADGGTSKGSP
jgi:AcrR family transcriptional regulator